MRRSSCRRASRCDGSCRCSSSHDDPQQRPGGPPARRSGITRSAPAETLLCAIARVCTRLSVLPVHPIERLAKLVSRRSSQISLCRRPELAPNCLSPSLIHVDVQQTTSDQMCRQVGSVMSDPRSMCTGRISLKQAERSKIASGSLLTYLTSAGSALVAPCKDSICGR